MWLGPGCICTHYRSNVLDGLPSQRHLHYFRRWVSTLGWCIDQVFSGAWVFFPHSCLGNPNGWRRMVSESWDHRFQLWINLEQVGLRNHIYRSRDNGSCASSGAINHDNNGYNPCSYSLWDRHCNNQFCGQIYRRWKYKASSDGGEIRFLPCRHKWCCHDDTRSNPPLPYRGYLHGTILPMTCYSPLLTSAPL